jgi:Cu/Ag efflux protein CusF
MGGMFNTTYCRRAAAGIVLTGGILAAASCSSDKQAQSEKSPPPAFEGRASASDGAKRTVAVVEGEAGGIVEDSYTASATVRSIDAKTRKITLQSESGKSTTFTAPPEVRNFDQIRIGDRVQATIAQRLTVFVSETAVPGEAQAALLARAEIGAKPGAMYAESFEAVTTVDSIDAVNRRATLRYADGETLVVPVRKDVDLTKYKVGDRVVMRVTERLSVLVESP